MSFDKYTLRWENYVLIKNEHFDSFWNNHLVSTKKLLFILGKGFDCRMNLAIEKIKAIKTDANIECILIQFDEGKTSSSHKYKEDVDTNVTLLNSLGLKIQTRNIDLLEDNGSRKKRRIGSRQAAEQIIKSYDDLSEYTDIVVDISSLPRGIYFSLIAKILYLLDKNDEKKEKNFFVIASENANIDLQIKENGMDEDLDYLHGFGGGLDLDQDSPIIWLPILGEDKHAHIEKAFTFITPDELCPILPFPAKNPRRGDQMIMEYYKLLFESLSVEPQNIMYVSEQNPFDVYRKLCNTIIHYKKSTEALGNCRAALTTFSSKILSIGVLLAAYDLFHCQNDTKKIGVGVVNVDSQGYDIEDINSFRKMKNESELFVIWLSGEPYSIDSND